MPRCRIKPTNADKRADRPGRHVLPFGRLGLAGLMLVICGLGFVSADDKQKKEAKKAPATKKKANLKPPPTGLTYPVSIAADKQGAIYLADPRSHSVWKLAGNALTQYFKGSRRNRKPINAVRCVEVDAEGQVLAGDTGARDVFRFDKTRKPIGLTKANDKDFGIGMPMDMVFNKDGDLLVADLEKPGHIWKVPKEGGKPQRILRINAPRGIALDSKQQMWVVSARKLVRVSSDLKPEVVVKEGVFRFPHTVTVDKNDNVYVCDGYAKTIWRLPGGAKPEKWVEGGDFVNPVGMAWRGENLLVVDPRAMGVFEITPDAQIKKLEIK